MADVKDLKRIFKYAGMELPDPDGKMDVEEVKRFYSNIYPEMTQSVIEGPEYSGSDAVYTIEKAVGTKG